MLNELQKEMARVVAERFPLNQYTPTQRLLAVMVQMGDLADLLLIKEGVKDNHKKQHLNYKEAVAAVFVDLLVLSQQLDVDLDKEIQRAIHWFKHGELPA